MCILKNPFSISVFRDVANKPYLINLLKPSGKFAYDEV
jgi:hypothetical protein